MRGSVLGRLLFGPGHLDSAVVLGAAPAACRPLALVSVRVVVVVRTDARQTQH